MSINFPHIQYIWDNNPKTTKMYYLGGDIQEVHQRLKIGNQYRVSQALYAENKDNKRVKVWVCNDDENKGKMCRINISNFNIHPINKLRDNKLEKILKK